MITIIGILIAITTFVSCSVREKKFEAPLFDNLGNYWIETTTKSLDANRFFVQGMLMSYGFNHQESARSFREAIRLDSTYSMAYWGLAYVLGPNYNLGMSEEDKAEVRWAVAQANRYSAKVSDWEQALVETINVKFPSNSDEPNEEAYAEAMKDLPKKFPYNPDILTLAAESIMNIHAWDLYEKKGGAAKSWTPDIVSLLEKAIELDFNHPLANHLYIHATEASSKPEVAYQAARKLKTLVPGSGHLVHMPSHVYINTGDYHMGTEVNEQAVLVDSTYVAQCKVQGVYPQLYYPHNYHFLSACAALEGNGSKSLEASLIMTDIIDKNYLGMEGYETTQHFMTVPYNVMVKFAQWEKILGSKKPDETYPYLIAVWSYARGMAFANTGQMDLAAQMLKDLKQIASTEQLEKLLIFDINAAQEVAEIAIHVLTAELADKSGNYTLAEKELLAAIEIEDQLNYNEPPDWFFSIRHLLGDLYLRNDEALKAEKVYREDLVTFPKNGFALNGLYHSLDMQGKTEESMTALQNFNESWKYSDAKLGFSRIDERSRQEYTLNIKPSSPSNLIYLATKFCGLN